MKSRLFALILVALVLLLGSCDALFNSNLFKEAKLGQVDSTALASSSSESLITQASPSMFDALAADASAKAAVLATLTTTYNDAGATPALAQESAALAAQIELETTGGTDLVNGLVSGLTSAGDFSSMTPADIADTFSAIIPSSLSTEAAFAAAIQGLLDSATALDALGTNITDNGAATDASTLGNAAQAALLVAVIDGIDYTATADSADSPAQYLWKLKSGTADTTGLSFTTPDTSAGTSLGDLLAAAGLDLSAFGL